MEKCLVLEEITWASGANEKGGGGTPVEQIK